MKKDDITYLFLYAVTLILLVAKLWGVYPLSWWTVFLPPAVPILFALIFLVIVSAFVLLLEICYECKRRIVRWLGRSGKK